MEVIRKYFSELKDVQYERFAALLSLYVGWNNKINVISRKDMDHLYVHHALHSLGIAKVINFLPGTKVLDVGTGGGFPGIPLAIFFPDTEFLLVDSIGKKILVVEEVVDALGLENVKARQMRAETIDEQFDFVVSRAVTSLPVFSAWVKHLIKPGRSHPLPNGILYLKGGDFDAELEQIMWQNKVFDLSQWFKEAFFETKKLVHLKRP